MKIGIVGPELSKWKSKEQIEKAKYCIKDILMGYIITIVMGKTNTILVSGHCPVGKERWYCTSCGKWLTEGETLICERLHAKSLVKVYDEGGIDTEAEIMATALGIRKEIYPAEVNQWKDGNEKITSTYHDETFTSFVKRKGYKSRNIQIAEACDILYCIVPSVAKNFKDCKTREGYCIHCDKYGHPTNGGCYTKRKTAELDKETHLVIIE